MKISSKVMIIQLIIIAGLLIFVLVGGFLRKSQDDMFIDAAIQHNEKVIDLVLTSEQDDIVSPLNDNSEWDETVNYIKAPAADFEKDCFDPLLQTYGFNMIAVFNPEGSLLYQVHDSGSVAMDRIFNTIQVQRILSRQHPKCRFFAAEGNEIFEIFGATVVPTIDTSHHSEPKGFLFFVKYWDTDYVRHIGELSRSEVRFDFGDTLNVNHPGDESVVYRNMKDWAGNSISQASFRVNDPMVEEWKQRSRTSSVQTILLGVTIILLLTYAFRRWISKPLMVSLDELANSEQRFHQVAENAGEWIWEIDESGRYIYSSSVVEKILGYTPEELVNKKYFYELFPGNLRQAMKEEVFRSIERREVFKELINPNIHKNGEVVILQTSATPFFDLHGKFKGYRGADMNITDYQKALVDLKDALARAEENDRLKTAFLNNISHEIRTPMNAILGYSNLLNDPGLLPEKRKMYNDILGSAASQLLSIIDDIISIATVEAGQEVARNNEFNLNAAMRALHSQFLLKTGSKAISFGMSLALPDEEAFIESDETKLVQVISNLLTNAFKFTREGHIEFGYKVINHELLFHVNDSGIGVPKALHGIIFDRFRQADESIVREYGGTGLGLAISKAYVELLGGTIGLKSEQGKGSSFFFTIPLLKAVLDHHQPPNVIFVPHLKAKNQVHTVLIAEDEELNFLLIQEMMNNLGWKTIRANNGNEAIELCRDHPEIELVLMDLKMPQVDGYEATRVIRTFRKDLPIVVQSAYIQEASKRKAFEAGADDYIIKPFSQETFLEITRRLLQNGNTPAEEDSE